MIGERAENFILKDQYGKDFELYKNLDTKVLLVFYPKDNSMVCSAQLRDYEANFDEFAKNNINVIGVNIESIESHADFCMNKKINFPILSDTDKLVSKFFNALNLLHTNKRKLVLIDTDKKIKYERSVFSVTYLNTKSVLQDLIKLNLI